MPQAEPGHRLRVAINASFWGQETAGSGQYLHHLAEALAAQEDGPEIVLCGRPGLRAVCPLPPGVAWRDVPVSPWRRLGGNPEKVWFEQVAYPRAARASGADLAHVPYFASPIAPAQPTLVTVHDLIPLLLPGYRSSALVRMYMGLVAAAARRAALVLTDSEASRHDIVRHVGIPSERVRSIPLAASPALRPAEGQAVADLRARYGLPERYLLYLGGFDQRRNLPVLLAALALARRREPALPPLALAGALPAAETALIPDPRRLAAEAGLGEAVRFLGRVPEGDKAALYTGALAYLFPSRYEGFGLTVLEALACGTPVAVANATSLPEVCGPGGLWVDPGDVPGWAEAILRLAGDAALRAQLRAAGFERAARFSWQRTAQETAAAYRHLASTLPLSRGGRALHRQ